MTDHQNDLPPPLSGGSPLYSRTPPASARLINKRPLRLALFLGASIISLSLIYAFIIIPSHRGAAEAKSQEKPRTHKPNPPAEISSGPSSYRDLTLPPPLGPGNKDLPNESLLTPPSLDLNIKPLPEKSVSTHNEDYDRALISKLFFEPSKEAGPLKEPVNKANALRAGTFIPAALITAVNTERSGPILALITEPVYDSASGSIILIPQGTRLMGRTLGDSDYGTKRAHLIWERLIFEDGRSVILPKEPGIDTDGAGGIKGRIDRRLAELGLASLAAGTMTTLGELAKDRADHHHSLIGDIGNAASIEAARTGSKQIDRELSVKPVLNLAKGSRLGLLLTQDLVIEPLP
jgi:type IV secretion system protein VirB10